MDLSLSRAFNLQMDRVGSGGQQQSAKFERPAILKRYAPVFCIQR
jgi:hypothetical protein